MEVISAADNFIIDTLGPYVSGSSTLGAMFSKGKMKTSLVIDDLDGMENVFCYDFVKFMKKYIANCPKIVCTANDVSCPAVKVLSSQDFVEVHFVYPPFEDERRKFAIDYLQSMCLPNLNVYTRAEECINEAGPDMRQLMTQIEWAIMDSQNTLPKKRRADDGEKYLFAPPRKMACQR